MYTFCTLHTSWQNKYYRAENFCGISDDKKRESDTEYLPGSKALRSAREDLRRVLVSERRAVIVGRALEVVEVEIRIDVQQGVRTCRGGS